MKDWNVVVTVREGYYREARRFLAELGPVTGTDYYNVLVMRVPEPRELLRRLEEWREINPDLPAILGRVSPAEEVFGFQDPEELEERARTVVSGWLDRLAGKRFHVRMHRRGFKGRLSSQDEERFLDAHIREALQARGTDATVDFADPDVIIDVETVGQRAGMACWNRDDLAELSFLQLD